MEQFKGVDKEQVLALLRIKDSDIRTQILRQGKLAVDKSIHIGGAFSLTIPMVTLFYGGFIKLDIKNPTSTFSDKFVLSKGHAIAAMAAVYTDLGYFGEELFDNARSYDSILNAHPGPILPGVHISTGPLGQGISAAVGLAQEQQCNESNKVYCFLGDGEAQEGIVWESAMFAGARNLKNFCVLVDYNHGQNDDLTRLVLPIGDIEAKFESFGFNAISVNGTRYDEIYDAFEYFASGRSDKPVAIISDTTKGEGGFSGKTTSHKTSFSDEYLDREIGFQRKRRERRVENLREISKELSNMEELKKAAAEMRLEIVTDGGSVKSVDCVPCEVITQRAPERKKSLVYPETEMPKLTVGEMYQCDHVLSDIVAAFGNDEKMVTIDADMGNITGLDVGLSRTNRRHSFNVGIAESNMMGISEAFAACGYNVWCGTFGMFLDWRVMRRIAVSVQERQESIDSGGWLSKGHNLDITFVCAAANLDTQTNGATHISIDDANALSEVPHLRVIDVACPQMLLSVSRWIAQGNKGLIMLRMTRSKSSVLYDDKLVFEYGKGYAHGSIDNADIAVVSSGRGIYEALKACEALRAENVKAVAVDMPSYDDDMLCNLALKGKTIVFAEQNNGILFDQFLDGAYKRNIPLDSSRVLALSTKNADRNRRFLHSATYKELAERTGLDASGIVKAINAAK